MMQHDSQLNNNSTTALVDTIQLAVSRDLVSLSPLAVKKTSSLYHKPAPIPSNNAVVYPAENKAIEASQLGMNMRHAPF